MNYKDYLDFNLKTQKILYKISSKLNFNILEESVFFCFFDEEASVDYQGSVNLHYIDDKIDFTFYITLVSGKYYYNYFLENLLTKEEIEVIDIPIKKLKKETIFNTINKYYLLH